MTSPFSDNREVAGSITYQDGNKTILITNSPYARNLSCIN